MRSRIQVFTWVLTVALTIVLCAGVAVALWGCGSKQPPRAASAPRPERPTSPAAPAVATAAVPSVDESDKEGYVWNDGFLERTYAVAGDAVKVALSDIFGLTIAVSQSDDGTTQQRGVGDAKGVWSAGGATLSSVGTIRELEVKDGGVTVWVKTVKNGDNTTCWLQGGGR